MSYPAATDGGVEVDSNTGTVEELQAEIATETAKPRGTGAAPVVAKKAPAPTEDDGEAEGAEAVEAETTVDKPAVTTPAGTAKKKKSLQARIDEIRGDLGDTTRERDASRAEVARLQGELEALKKKPAKAGAHAGVPFTAERFPKYVDYLKDHPDVDMDDWVELRDAWKDGKAAAVAEVEAETRTVESRANAEHSAAFTKKATSYLERMAPVLKADPKFYEKIDPRLVNTPAMSALPPGVTPKFGNWLVEQIIRSEYPKELLEHLSLPKVSRRLVTLQPEDALRYITKFELDQRPAGANTGPSADEHSDDEEDDDREIERPVRRAAATERSEAEPPVKPVRGSSQQSTGDEEPGDDASDDEWAKWERRRIAKRRTGSTH